MSKSLNYVIDALGDVIVRINIIGESIGPIHYEIDTQFFLERRGA